MPNPIVPTQFKGMGEYWEQTSAIRNTRLKNFETTNIPQAPIVKREASLSSSSSSDEEIVALDKDYKPSASILAVTKGVKAERSSPEPPLFHIKPSPSASPELNANPFAWKHPDELEYDTSEQWTDDAILTFLTSNAFSVAPKPLGNRRQFFFTVTSTDGTTTALPARYRVPLLWVAQYLWDSLALVWNALEREREWGMFKHGILHVARLCVKFFEKARVAMEDGLDGKWRCGMFDRALLRYRMKWLFVDPATVKEFWSLYGEKEYDKDVLNFDWRRWALKGHKGFKITEKTILRGVSADELRKPLKHIDGAWFWERANTDGTVTLVPLPGTTAPTSPNATNLNDNSYLATHPSKQMSTPADACPVVPSPAIPNPLDATVVDVDMLDESSLPPHSASLPSTSTVRLAPRAEMASFAEEVFTSFTSTVKSLTDELNNLRDEVQVLKEENTSYRSSRSARQHPYQPQTDPRYDSQAEDSHPHPYHHDYGTNGTNGYHVAAGESISVPFPRLQPQRQFFTYPPPAPPVDYVPSMQYPDSPPTSATPASEHAPTNPTHSDVDTEMFDSSHPRSIIKTESECSMPAFSPYTYKPLPYARSSGGGLGEAMSMDDVDGMGGMSGIGGPGLGGPVKSQRKRFTRG